MTYKGYTGHADYYPEDRIFYGTVLDLNDVITFQGTTVEELEQAFRDSVDEYLALCEELGQEPEKPFSGRLNLRMDPDLHRRLHNRAQQHATSINSLIVSAIEKEIA